MNETSNPPQDQAFFLFDTETGGLDPRISPLLSLAGLVLSKDLQETIGFSLLVKPPEGTVLEVPHPATMGVENKRKQIAYHVDARTLERTNPTEENFCISALAAEINGFVTLTDQGVWDMESPKAWLQHGLELAEAERTWQKLLRQSFAACPIPVGHNVSFDLKFVRTHMPNLYKDFARDEQGNVLCVDTCAAFRKYRAEEHKRLKKEDPKVKKGSAKLTDLAQICGYDLKNAHEALADCRATHAGLLWLKDQGYFSLSSE